MKKIILIISCLTSLGLYAAKPSWQVNSNGFQYSMEIFAAVEIDGTVLSNTNDLLAAFSGNECRGVVQSTNNPFTGQKTFFLVVYANSANETLNFKAYDASKDKVVELKNTITFQINSSQGSIAAPYMMSNEERANGLEFVLLNSQENAVYGSTVGYFIHYVNGDAVSSDISIESIDDFVGFSINNDSLVVNTIWNYEEKNLYHINVTSRAEKGSISKEISINISDVNESPTALYLSNDTLDENVTVGTVVGQLSVDDEDTEDEFEFALSSENAFFEIDGNSLKTKAKINYEFIQSHPLTITVEDKGGKILAADFTITVNNVNDAPSIITLSADSIPAGLPEYMTVGYFSVKDEDEFDKPVLKISENEDFILNPNNSHLITAKSFDTKGDKTISITADDGKGGILTTDFDIKITDKGYSFTEKNVNVMFTGTDVFTHTFDVESHKINLTISTLDNYGRYNINSSSLIDKYEVYSSNGQLLQSNKVGLLEFDLNISTLAIGNYIINIHTEQGTIAEKLSLSNK